jgi:hypothetical protein
MVNTISITNQAVLGVAYGIIAVLVFLVLIKTKWKGADERAVAEEEETTIIQPLAVEG